MCWTRLPAKQSTRRQVGSRGIIPNTTCFQIEVTGQRLAGQKLGRSTIWYFIAVRVLWLASIVVAGCAFALPQPQQRFEPQSEPDRELLLAFSQKSARELVIKYFERPPYPLFVIRRLTVLADPGVIPVIRDAFERETQTLTRQFLAAALVRLGDADPRYYDYVARAALEAVSSDAPYRDSSTALEALDGGPQPHSEVYAWAQDHGVPLIQRIRAVTIELPAAVEALGEAADRRSAPILLRGLESPNVLVVREAAFGLARLHDTAAVQPIIAACRRSDPEERPWIARSLLYFHSKKAQQAANAMIADPARLQRWRVDVTREEVMQTAVTKWSRAIQRLDRAALQLEQLSEAMELGNPSAAETALKQYLHDFAEFRKELAPMSLGRQEYALAAAVLDRLETQISRLERMTGFMRAGRSTSVEEPLIQLKATLRMMQDKVIQSAK